MNPRPIALILGWLAAAVGAVAIGVVAVSALGDSITSTSTSGMSQDEVGEALADSRAADASGSDDPVRDDTGRSNNADQPNNAEEREPDPDPTPHGIPSPGGQVTATCDGSLAHLESWSPAQGFSVDDVDRGPAHEVSVEFEANDRDVEVDVRCENGKPRHQVDADNSDDHDDDDDEPDDDDDDD